MIAIPISPLPQANELAPLTLADIERYAAINSTQALMARHMLTVVNRGQRLVTKYSAPIQVWQFGADLTLVALPAEPVAEYAHLLRKALGPEKLWVAGYNNDCFGYLPSAQVVKEGGHEHIGITLWIWGESPAPNAGFTEDVQDVVVNTVSKLAKQAGRPALRK